MSGPKAEGGQPPELPAFELERYFAKWEFSAPHLLCCSDCEPLTLAELLALGDGDSKKRWEQLRLGYGETRGMPELRQEVAGMYDNVRPDDVIICAPEECIYLCMRALLRPGDHVVVSYPGYQSLYDVARSVGCEVSLWEVQLDGEGGPAFDVGDLKALLRPTTRLVVVNFPHNPTGALPSRPQWDELVGACRTVGAHLFSDEMYRLMELDPTARLPSAVDVYDKAVTLSGMSKALGLPGLRIGWLATRDTALLDRVAELKDYTTICNSQPSEVLALMALRARDAILDRNMGIVRHNLTAVRTFMDTWRHVFHYTPPAAGSVAFPRLAAEGDEGVEAFCDRVVGGCGVLLLPATVYGHAPAVQRRHFRIGLGRRDLPRCLEVLEGFLRQQGQGQGQS